MLLVYTDRRLFVKAGTAAGWITHGQGDSTRLDANLKRVASLAQMTIAIAIEAVHSKPGLLHALAVFGMASEMIGVGRRFPRRGGDKSSSPLSYVARSGSHQGWAVS